MLNSVSFILVHVDKVSGILEEVEKLLSVFTSQNYLVVLNHILETVVHLHSLLELTLRVQVKGLLILSVCFSKDSLRSEFRGVKTSVSFQFECLLLSISLSKASG